MSQALHLGDENKDCLRDDVYSNVSSLLTKQDSEADQYTGSNKLPHPVTSSTVVLASSLRVDLTMMICRVEYKLESNPWRYIVLSYIPVYHATEIVSIRV
jgi:hypothetical protein